MRLMSVLLLLVVAFVGRVNATEVTPGAQPRYGYVSDSWIAVYADHRTGRTFANTGNLANSQDAAHGLARDECAQATGRTCVGVAMPSNDDIVALHCVSGNRRQAFVGGSAMNQAYEVALGKARDAGFRESSCTQKYSY